MFLVGTSPYLCPELWLLLAPGGFCPGAMANSSLPVGRNQNQHEALYDMTINVES